MRTDDRHESGCAVLGAERSFQLATGWFYPDFVALLNDGRILIVEYKGAHLINDPNTKQKDNVGVLWETKSQEKGLFLMAEKEKGGLGVSEQIKRKFVQNE